MNSRSIVHHRGLTFQKMLGVFSTHRFAIHSVIILGFGVLFGIFALSNPVLEWDMIAYVANAKQLYTEVPIEQLRQTVYAELKNSVPSEDYNRLIGSASRKIISEDNEAFRQTIAFFYDTRIIYLSILAGLMKMDMNPFYATYFISTICIVLSFLLLATLLPRSLPYGLCLALPFLMISSEMLEVARFSTPDGMATLMTVGMYWCLVRRSYWLLVLIPLSIFVRTDLILLAPLFLGYLFIDKQFSRLWLICSGALTIVAYLTLNHFIVDGDPWSSLIGYNLAVKPTHPETYSYQMTVGDYLSHVAGGLRKFSYQPMFFMFCALSIIGCFVLVPRIYKNQSMSHFKLPTDMLFIVASSFAYFFVHFLLFPIPMARFQAAQYALVSVVVIWAVLILLSERSESRDFLG